MKQRKGTTRAGINIGNQNARKAQPMTTMNLRLPLPYLEALRKKPQGPSAYVRGLIEADLAKPV